MLLQRCTAGAAYFRVPRNRLACLLLDVETRAVHVGRARSPAEAGPTRFVIPAGGEPVHWPSSHLRHPGPAMPPFAASLPGRGPFLPGRAASASRSALTVSWCGAQGVVGGVGQDLRSAA